MEPSHPYRGKMVAERARGRPAVSAPTGSEGEISASINKCMSHQLFKSRKSDKKYIFTHICKCISFYYSLLFIDHGRK